MNKYYCVILGRVGDNYKTFNTLVKELDNNIRLDEYMGIETFLDKNNLKHTPIQSYDYKSKDIQGFFLDDENWIVGVVVSTK